MKTKKRNFKRVIRKKFQELFSEGMNSEQSIYIICDLFCLRYKTVENIIKLKKMEWELPK